MFTAKFDAPCCITGQTALRAAFGSDRLYLADASEVAFRGVVTLEPDISFTGSCIIGDSTNAVPVTAPEATPGVGYGRGRGEGMRRSGEGRQSRQPAPTYSQQSQQPAQQQSAPESAPPPRQPRGEGV